MTLDFFKTSPAFISKKKTTHLVIEAVKDNTFEGWLKKQGKAIKALVKQMDFAPKSKRLLVLRDKEQIPTRVIALFKDETSIFDGAVVASMLERPFSESFLDSASFEFSGLEGEDLKAAYIGWGFAAYAFDQYKAKQKKAPALTWVKGVDKKAVLSVVDSVNALRDLVNTPANLLGPQELEDASRALAEAHEAKVKVITGKDLLKKNFPLVYTVGMGSPRESRLIEFTHGDAKYPKLTLVGKGVIFDTGGLDIKPSSAMRFMKKDMGGAAHVLALAKLILDSKMKVSLRVIIPAVENAVGGAAFRPGDIIKSRKGLFIENTNTDAEGRLILADALSYACEDKPDLVIDYATLTGSARAGLGPDIPAFFCNNEDVHEPIRKAAKSAEDPIWPMPLHQPYRKHVETGAGDMINSTGIPGDGIYSALFLESFIDQDVEWMHLDCFSWESSGRPGRPVGAADTGLRAIYEYLNTRYG
ncbi:MAG: leucyl aminopeptidase family protein [Micavibrio sp.]|nr:leucyl aminopeptidase family protein [Micavibrio sp.]